MLPCRFSHVLKTDDDCYVRLPKLVEMVQDMGRRSGEGMMYVGRQVCLLTRHVCMQTYSSEHTATSYTDDHGDPHGWHVMQTCLACCLYAHCWPGLACIRMCCHGLCPMCSAPDMRSALTSHTLHAVGCSAGEPTRILPHQGPWLQVVHLQGGDA